MGNVDVHDTSNRNWNRNRHDDALTGSQWIASGPPVPGPSGLILYPRPGLSRVPLSYSRLHIFATSLCVTPGNFRASMLKMTLGVRLWYFVCGASVSIRSRIVDLRSRGFCSGVSLWTAGLSVSAFNAGQRGLSALSFREYPPCFTSFFTFPSCELLFPPSILLVFLGGGIPYLIVLFVLFVQGCVVTL